MSAWLRKQNQHGIWCRRLSIGLSNSAEFEYMSKLGETYSKLFNFGFSRNGEARSHRFEWEQRTSSQVTQPDVNPSSSTVTFVAKTTKNTVGTSLSTHNLDIPPTSKKMEMASCRILWRTWVRRAEKVSRTACVNSLGLTMRAPLMLDRYAGAREHFNFGNRKFR